MIGLRPYIVTCICLSAFKLLFLKSYVSTDFDVHRNWMAITYNLPIKSWYFDSTSEWTLDYPPLFAAFEFLVALLAHTLNLTDILTLTSEAIRTETCIIFQKVTVILSDCLYYYAVYVMCRSVKCLMETKKQTNKQQGLLQAFAKPDSTTSLALLLLLQPALILVDHIHFQYNGFLNGFFLLSIANIIPGNVIMGSFWFALLLNLKHIYLYCAPAFGMYLLTSYCMNNKGTWPTNLMSFIKKFTTLAVVVASVFVIVYMPFAELSVLKQILHRLFPFQRGLTHTYWAPNFWALYNTVDKLLASTIHPSTRPITSSTSGLVQEFQHQYLPTITPSITFYTVAAFNIPLAFKFLMTKNKTSPILFIKGVAVAAFTSFMFGWHVHEKAIIIILLPLILLAILDNRFARPLLRLSLSGTYSLFPLFFQSAEYLTKVTVLLFYYSLASRLVEALENENLSLHSDKQQAIQPRSRYRRASQAIDRLYIFMIVVLELYVSFIHGRLADNSWIPVWRLKHLEFLPLLLTSLVSALGTTLGYLELSWSFYLGR